MFKGLIQSFLTNLLALWVATLFLTGFTIKQDFRVYAIAAGVLMLVNFFVKPILNVVSFPISLITLGFFRYLINIGLLYLTIILVNGVTVKAGILTFKTLGMFAVTLPQIELSKFLTIIVASLIISLVNWVVHKVLF